MKAIVGGRDWGRERMLRPVSKGSEAYVNMLKKRPKLCQGGGARAANERGPVWKKAIKKGIKTHGRRGISNVKTNRGGGQEVGGIKGRIWSDRTLNILKQGKNHTPLPRKKTSRHGGEGKEGASK